MRMRRVLLAAALPLVVVACGDDSGGGLFPSTTTASAATTAAAAVTTTTVAATTTSEGRGGGLGGGFGSGTTTTTSPGAPTTTPAGIVTVEDDTGQITVDVPATWDDVFGAAWSRSDVPIGPAITASTDRQAWLSGWEVSGVFIGATTTFPGTVDEVLDQWSSFDDCTFDDRYDYDDGIYTGRFNWWDDCGGIGTIFVTIVARPADEAFTVVVQLQVIAQDDPGVIDTIVDSFLVSGADL